jgi:hypothetical protein
MTQAQLVTDLTSDVVMVAFLASVLFVAAYSALAPWWRSSIGRALVVMDAGLTLTLAPSVLHRVLGVTISASLPFAWYFCASLAIVAGSTLWRTWIMSRTQWQVRHKDGDTWLATFLSPWRAPARRIKAAWLWVFGDVRKEIGRGTDDGT